MPLKIGAKCREPAERAYFAEHVEPRLGGAIEYLGELGHEEKVELLRNARATLFPIDWEEPFGLVMIESLACGTPVIATRRGSVPEVIEHGRTGMVVERHADFAAAVAEIDRIDRAGCRRASRGALLAPSAGEGLPARVPGGARVAVRRAGATVADGCSRIARGPRSISACSAPELPTPLARRFEAAVFDWDGTAVPDRRADASESAADRGALRSGFDVAIVSGTHVGNVDGQLAARPEGPGACTSA